MGKMQIELTTGESLLVLLSKEEFEKKVMEAKKGNPFMELPVKVAGEEETMNVNLLTVVRY